MTLKNRSCRLQENGKPEALLDSCGPTPKHGPDVLREMHAKLSGRKEVRKEALSIAAAIKWRGVPGVSEVVRELLQP